MRGSAPNTVVLAFVVLVAGSSLAGAQYAGNGNREGMQRQTPPMDMSMMGPMPVAPTVAALVLEHAETSRSPTASASSSSPCVARRTRPIVRGC